MLVRQPFPQLAIRLAETALFCGLTIFFLDAYSLVLISATLSLLLLFPGWRWPLLAASSLAHGMSPIFWQNLGYLGAHSALELWTLRLAFYLGGTALALAAVAFCSRLRFSFLWLLLLLLGLFMSVHPVRQEGWQVVPLALALVCSQKFFASAWLLGLPYRKIFSLSGFVSLGGFWTAGASGICPVPAGRAQLLASDVSGSDAAWSLSRRRGLRLLLVVLLLMAVQYLAGRWIFGPDFQGALSDRRWAPSHDLSKFGWNVPFGFPSLPLNELVLKPVLIISLTLLDIGIRFGYYVAAARMAGFDLPPMIGKFWEARSFTEFLGKCYYYYNRILLQFFFWPNLFRRFPRHWQAPLTTFLMVFTGGVLFHFIRDFGDIQRKGLLGAAQIYLDSVSYYAVLGTAAAWGVGARKAQWTWWPEARWLRIAAYFLLFAWIYTLLLNSRYLRFSEGDTWRMLERFLGKN